LSDIKPIEDLQRFIIEHGLPATEMALFGVKCPYCGKSDRIRALDPPEDMTDVIGPDATGAYAALLEKLPTPASSIGVCQFCRNCSEINGSNQALPLALDAY